VITETISLLDDKLEELADYGATEPQVSYLKNSFDHFLVLNGRTRQYRIDSVVATKSLKELFSETNVLLKTRLDRVMKGYEYKDPEYCKGYLAARVVVNS
jgi:hypothetical protein